MAENREFTVEELYKRLLHRKMGTILSLLQTLREETMIWEHELELVKKEIEDAPK